MCNAIEINFQVQGAGICSQHGYWLYSAITSQIPIAKQLEWQLSSITGQRLSNHSIKLNPNSRFLIRTSVKNSPIFCQLESVLIHQTRLTIINKSINPIVPKNKLTAQTVVIKGKIEPQEFIRSAQFQLSRKQIEGQLLLINRKTFKIKKQSIVGYRCQFHPSTDSDSIKLQQLGLGGRNKMGCGVFC